MSLSFRRMTGDDLPRLWRWLQEPHVREHYDDGHRTLAAVVDYYGDAVAGREPTHGYVGTSGDAPIAYLQWPVTGARTCWIGPAPSNRRAIRAYETAGFSFVALAHVPGEPEPEYLMRLAPWTSRRA